MTRTGNQKFAQHIHHSGQIVDPDDASTTVESSLGSIQTVYSYTTVLDDAQTKDLPSNPQGIVPAPGAGFAIIPLSGFVRAFKNQDSGRYYTNVDDTAALHFVAGSAGDYSDFSSKWIFTGDSNEVLSWWFNASNTTGFFYMNDLENQPIWLRASNASAGAFTGGHPDNTLTVTVFYMLFPTAS